MKRATRDYLSTLRLTLSDEQHQAVSSGKTPRSLPKHLIVDRVEFHGSRIFPSHDQELLDYKVFYLDDTYDCISITPAMNPPVAGKFWSRIDASISTGQFLTWDEV